MQNLANGELLHVFQEFRENFQSFDLSSGKIRRFWKDFDFFCRTLRTVFRIDFESEKSTD